MLFPGLGPDHTHLTFYYREIRDGKKTKLIKYIDICLTGFQLSGVQQQFFCLYLLSNKALTYQSQAEEKSHTRRPVK